MAEHAHSFVVSTCNIARRAAHDFTLFSQSSKFSTKYQLSSIENKAKHVDMETEHSETYYPGMVRKGVLVCDMTAMRKWFTRTVYEKLAIVRAFVNSVGSIF